MSELDVHESGETGGTGEQEGGHEYAQDVLDEAREGGWKPQDEMKDPSRYVDPETFVKRGREILPIVHKNNERLKKEVEALKSQVNTANLSVKKLQEYHAALEQKAYERAVRDLKAQKKEAIESGDFSTVAEIEDQIDIMKESKPQPLEEPKPQAAPGIPPILQNWMEENKSWYNDDNTEMLDYANAVSIRLRRQDPDNKVVGETFLDSVLKAVKKQFPEKFGTKRSAASAVEGGNPGGSSTRSGTKLADLPPEARAAYKDLATEDWYKDLAKSQKMTTEQLYIQDYGM